MFNSKIAHSLLFAGCLAVSNLAYATVPTIYNFGSLLTGTGPTIGSPFAQLGATNNGGGVWTFLLTINSNFSTYFGTNAFIKTMTFDYGNPDLPGGSWQPTTSIINTSGQGVSTVTASNGIGAPSFDTDFGSVLGGGSDKLKASEWVKWQVSGLGSSSLTNVFAHVQGMSCSGCSSSAKYLPVVTAVPEPETYAMLLAGLGLLGFSARRKIKHV